MCVFWYKEIKKKWKLTQAKPISNYTRTTYIIRFCGCILLKRLKCIAWNLNLPPYLFILHFTSLAFIFMCPWATVLVRMSVCACTQIAIWQNLVSVVCDYATCLCSRSYAWYSIKWALYTQCTSKYFRGSWIRYESVVFAHRWM